MSKILIISAHPDDEVIGIGGILKKLSKQHEINILFLADGITARKNSGHVNSTNYEPTEKMKAEMQKEIDIRKRHAKNALKVLGVKNMKFLDLPDNELDTVPFLKIVKEVEKEIKSTKCNMIFTHHHNDLNIDHRIAYEASITASRPIFNSKIKAVSSFESIIACCSSDGVIFVISLILGKIVMFCDYKTINSIVMFQYKFELKSLSNKNKKYIVTQKNWNLVYVKKYLQLFT